MFTACSTASATDASPLKTERIPNGIDILCIRELTGGLYFGLPKETTTLPDGDVQAVDTMVYRKSEIERITATAITAARARRKKLCSVDKANVLGTVDPLLQNRHRLRRAARPRHRPQPPLRGPTPPCNSCAIPPRSTCS